MRGFEGVLAHSQPDTSLGMLYALNPLLLRSLCVIRLRHQISRARADDVCGQRADGPAVSTTARPELDRTRAVLPVGVFARVELDAVEFASVGGSEAHHVCFVYGADGDFGAVRDADLIPLIVDDGVAHDVEYGCACDDFVLG